MAEQIGVSFREIFNMGVVGVGENEERQALCGARKQRRDAGHLADEDRVPAFEELRIGNADAECGADAGKKLGVADLSLFVPVIQFVARKPPDEINGLAAGVTSPARKCPMQVDIQHDAAEIEQQRIGNAGREAGRGHGACSFPGIQYRYGSISNNGNALKTLGGLVAVAGCRQGLFSFSNDVTPNSPNERITSSSNSSSMR